MAAEGTGSASCMNAESAEDGATGRVGFAVGQVSGFSAEDSAGGCNWRAGEAVGIIEDRFSCVRGARDGECVESDVRVGRGQR